MWMKLCFTRNWLTAEHSANSCCAFMWEKTLVSSCKITFVHYSWYNRHAQHTQQKDSMGLIWHLCVGRVAAAAGHTVPRPPSYQQCFPALSERTSWHSQDWWDTYLLTGCYEKTSKGGSKWGLVWSIGDHNQITVAVCLMRWKGAVIPCFSPSPHLHPVNPWKEDKFWTSWTPHPFCRWIMFTTVGHCGVVGGRVDRVRSSASMCTEQPGRVLLRRPGHRKTELWITRLPPARASKSPHRAISA